MTPGRQGESSRGSEKNSVASHPFGKEIEKVNLEEVEFEFVMKEVIFQSMGMWEWSLGWDGEKWG